MGKTLCQMQFHCITIRLHTENWNSIGLKFLFDLRVWWWNMLPSIISFIKGNCPSWNYHLGACHGHLCCIACQLFLLQTSVYHILALHTWVMVVVLNLQPIKASSLKYLEIEFLNAFSWKEILIFEFKFKFHVRILWCPTAVNIGSGDGLALNVQKTLPV